jgi:hypothetical protein
MRSPGDEAPFDVAEAVILSGRRPLRITPLSPVTGLLRKRESFRVETGAGTAIKARRLESEAAARRQQELRAGLPEGFAAVIARFGPILLEEWIDGRSLDAIPPDAALIRQAGTLMAFLHARTEAAGMALPFPAEIDGLRAEALAGLRAVAAAGCLESATIDRLCSFAAEAVPGAVPHRLIHTDICGENLVVDASGRIYVIDNEHFRFGPAGMDLARTWYRWGWCEGGRPAPQWEVFRQAYQAAGGAGEAFVHEALWRLAAAAISARLRVEIGHPDVSVPLHCLQAIAETDAVQEISA